ncbi:hypothetical protein DC432_16110 [Microbacterium testaceum]|jgi:hypothetical protein|uniref:Uncharacterized protein n=1 Tax=Microbacterium testaceum TaxID=2033 RepID=A0A2T7VPD8_MICTE|nr:hypothetical protein DC432_16110 [Microbacterium testaceum]
MKLFLASTFRHQVSKVLLVLCTTVALSAAFIVAGPATPTAAVVATALSSATLKATVASSETPSPAHQTHPHFTATPRADGRGVPTGGGETAPVMGLSVVALILGSAFVMLLITARRTRHLRRSQESDR